MVHVTTMSSIMVCALISQFFILIAIGDRIHSNSRANMKTNVTSDDDLTINLWDNFARKKGSDSVYKSFENQLIVSDSIVPNITFCNETQTPMVIDRYSINSV